jgi:hypothetical protein
MNKLAKKTSEKNNVINMELNIPQTLKDSLAEMHLEKNKEKLLSMIEERNTYIQKVVFLTNAIEELGLQI